MVSYRGENEVKHNCEDSRNGGGNGKPQKDKRPWVREKERHDREKWSGRELRVTRGRRPTQNGYGVHNKEIAEEFHVV